MGRDLHIEYDQIANDFTSFTKRLGDNISSQKIIEQNGGTLEYRGCASKLMRLWMIYKGPNRCNQLS
jgi:hypothetical protein